MYNVVLEPSEVPPLVTNIEVCAVFVTVDLVRKVLSEFDA